MWDVAVGATLACDGAPPTLGDVTLADGAAATESPCCSLRCSDTWYPIRGYQTNSLTTPRTGPERHVPVPNAAHAHQARMSRTWLGAWHCATARSDGWFRLSAVWAHWPTFYKKWARGR